MDVKKLSRRFPQLRIAIIALLVLGFTAPAMAVTKEKVRFFDFQFTVTQFSHGFPGPFPIAGQPVHSPHDVEADLTGPYDTASFRLIDENGRAIRTIDLLEMNHEDAPGYFIGRIGIPSAPFRVAASGLDKQGAPYDVVFPTLFSLQPVEVQFIGKIGEVKHGKTTTLTAEVTNHGGADTFSTAVTAKATLKGESLNFDPVSRVEPTQLTLGKGEKGTFEIDMTIPRETTGADYITLTASASSVTRSGVRNTAERNINFAKPSLFLLNLEIKEAQVEIDPVKGSFEVHGRITLDPESDGIDPLNEKVRIFLGKYGVGIEETIPAGSFVKEDRKFVYKREGQAGLRKIEIKENGDFKVKEHRVNTSVINLDKAVGFSLSIGNDYNAKSLRFERKGKNKGIFKSRDKDDDKDKDKSGKKNREDRR